MSVLDKIDRLERLVEECEGDQKQRDRLKQESDDSLEKARRAAEELRQAEDPAGDD